jgi:hypothetical protein
MREGTSGVATIVASLASADTQTRIPKLVFADLTAHISCFLPTQSITCKALF